MSNSDQEPFDVIAESFIELRRCGEQPTIDDFVRRYPEHAAEIRELFPALLLMEQVVVEQEQPTPEDACEAHPPRRLGNYRILREIGRGGMGVVYEAEHETLVRRAAVKVLPHTITVDDRALERFRREARAAAHLQHHNIVPVFEVGEDQGVHFYAMQYIEGEGLDRVVGRLRSTEPRESAIAPVTHDDQDSEPRGPAGPADVGEPAGELRAAECVGSDSSAVLPGGLVVSSSATTESGFYRSIARIGVQVAEALDHAHSHGVVHRDVKPSNILLDRQGIAWVADFGLAKLEGADLTHTGSVLGTLRYMAPEQLRGWADPRTDVYSLGLTLYELLTLRPAFLSESKAELLKQISDREPARPRLVDRSIPRDLETIVLRAIDKEAGRRYQSAAALCEDLTRFLERKPIRATRTSTIGHVSRWCCRNPCTAVLAGSVLLLLVVMTLGASTAAVWLARQAKDLRQQSKEITAEKTAALAQLFRATTNEARAARNSHGIGRRLNTLAAVRRAAVLLPQVRHSNEDVLELRNMAAAALAFADLRVETVIDTGPVARVALDGDLSLIALGERNGKVIVRRVADNTELVCLEGFGKPAYLSFFSDDGRFLAVVYGNVGEPSAAVRVWDWRQTQVVIETRGYPYGINFAPDGRSIAIPQLKETVEIYDLVTGEQRLVLQTKGDSPYPQFQPKHKILAVVSRRSFKVQRFHTETGQPGDDIRLPLAAEGIRWSPDGRYLAYGTGGNEVGLWDADAQRDAGTLVGHRSSAWPQQFTPAGDFLVTTGWDNRVIFWETSGGRPLVEVPGQAIRLSRDGRRLAVYEKGKRAVIYRVFVPEVFHHIRCSGHLRDVAVAPNGNLVAAVGDKGVWLLDDRLNTILQHDAVGDSQAVAFHPEDGSFVATSPRGVLCWEVLQNTATSRPQLGESRLIAPADIVTAFQRLGFSRSGDRLAYTATGWRVRVVSWQDPTQSSDFDIEPDLPGLQNIAISPDNRWLAAVTSEKSHVHVWDTESGALVHESGRWGGYGSALFSPGSQRLVVRYWTEYVVLETGTWRELHRIQRGPTTCGAMAFAPNGPVAALSLSNQLIRLYNTETFEPLLTLEAPLALDYTSCRFSPDGNRLYATSESGTVSYWDLGLIRQQLEDLGLAW